MPDLKDQFDIALKQLNQSLQKKNQSIRLFAFLRVLTFIAIILTARQLYLLPAPVLYFGLFLLVVLFLYLVRKSVNLGDDKKFLSQLIYIYTHERAVLNGQPSQFDHGEDFTNLCAYAADLDIYGEGSLFQLLNRTTTSHGRERLAHMLADPFMHAGDILSMQEALRVLTPQHDACFRITATGMVDRETAGNLHALQDWMSLPLKISAQSFTRIFRYIYPVLGIASLLFYLSSGNYIPMLIAVVIAWLVTGFYKKYIDAQHRLLEKKQAILQQYARILREFMKIDSGNSAKLTTYQGMAAAAHRAIFRLSRLTALFDQRNNLLVNFFMNSFLLYDIQCTLALEDWKKQHAPEFEGWVETVSNIELLTSLSAYARNNPAYVYPELSAEPAHLQVTQMGHPLIAASSMITNDLHPGKDEKVLLITGSNMAGKTTFLRSAGVNLVLARSGAPVCATRFSFSPMQILSSIRINDSLQEHTSYFMAELIRLKQISEGLQRGIPALILVDEILRGTNSDDKTFGSGEFIISMLQYPCIALFATHDLTLSVLEDQYPGVITNYSFESVIENNELSFDYILRKGVAKNKNASFLMKKMGIIR